MSYSKSQLEAQCRYRFKSSEKRSDVMKFLIEAGLDNSSANTLIEETIHELRFTSILVILIGFGLSLLGAIISIILTHSNGGIFIFLWWGPILIGFLVGVIGIFKYLKLYTK